jgi:nucleoside phosphorylase
MAQYELVHQFKDLGFPDIGFAQGTAQALFVGDFLYADSSTPSNFTVFAFHEQEPLSDSRQNDYLICQLVQIQGQKKSLDKIKASLKKTVHISTEFNSMGTQFQLFGEAFGFEVASQLASRLLPPPYVRSCPNSF